MNRPTNPPPAGRARSRTAAAGDLGAWLTAACAERDLSWAEASRRAGLFPGAISSFVRGARPGLNACKKLAAAFDVPVEHVLQLAGHAARPSLTPRPEIEALMREIEALPPAQRKALIAVWRAMLKLVAAGEDAPKR